MTVLRPLNLSGTIVCLTLTYAGDPQTASAAVVNQSQFKRAIEITEQLARPENSFVPFERTKEGCQDRALLLSMALAAEGIPSTAIYIHMRPGGPVLSNPKSTVDPWDFHVAPMIKQGVDGVEMILDPVVGVGTLSTYSAWIERMSANETDFSISRISGSIYWGITSSSTGRTDPILKSFSEMPPFKLREIGGACNELMGALLASGDSQNESVRDRQRRLLAEFSRLTKELIARGKVVDDMPYAHMCTVGNLFEGISGLHGDTAEVIKIH